MSESKSFPKRISARIRKTYDQIRGKSQEPHGRVPHNALTTSGAPTGERPPSLPPTPRVTIAGENASALAQFSGALDIGSSSDGGLDAETSAPASDIDIVVTLPTGVEEEGPNVESVPSSNPARQIAKNVLKGTLVVLSSALQGLPFPGAKGTVDTMIKLITVFEATAANAEALKTLNERCHRLHEIVIKPLESKDVSEISPEFQKILQRLESRMREVLSDAQKAQPGKLISAINNEDITLALKDVNDKITQLVDFFVLETHILGLISQGKVTEHMKHAKKHALHQLIQSLPKAKTAMYNSYLEDDKRSGCFQNTRQQLLGEIIEWIVRTSLEAQAVAPGQAVRLYEGDT